MAKKKNIKDMNTDELLVKLSDLKKSLINFRFQKSLQQLEHPKQITKIRREIAQIKTVLREFDLGLRGKDIL